MSGVHIDPCDADVTDEAVTEIFFMDKIFA